MAETRPDLPAADSIPNTHYRNVDSPPRDSNTGPTPPDRVLSSNSRMKSAREVGHELRQAVEILRAEAKSDFDAELILEV
jgi:hypothetical protein